MQSSSAVKQSTWGFQAADTTHAILTGCNGLTNGVGQSASGFKPISKSKSVSALNVMETSMEINDPKPMEQAKSASFKPLEPSHQTHNAKIVVPKPVSPPHDPKGKIPEKRSAAPPVESRASVLAPTKGSSQNQQIGVKQTDYSFYLDLINDGAEEVKEKASPVAPPRGGGRQVTGTVATDVSKNAVKSAKSIFENGSNLVKKTGN